MNLENMIVNIFNQNNIEIRSRNERYILFVCPFHESSGKDHNAIIYVDNGYWKCYNPCCGENGMIESFYSKVNRIPYRQAVRELQDGYNYSRAIDSVNQKQTRSIRINNIPLPPKTRRIEKIDKYMYENDYSLSVFNLLDIRYPEHTESEYILPYYKHSEIMGYARKIKHGRTFYPHGFNSNVHLYAYDLFKNHKHVYIVEGQRDVWRLMEHGYPAIGLNTAYCSEYKMSVIVDTWNSVTIMLDGDDAGYIGMKNFLKLEGLINFNYKLCELGKDPNDYRDKTAFDKLPVMSWKDFKNENK